MHRSLSGAELLQAHVACLNGAHVSHLTLRVGREPSTYDSQAFCL